MHCSYCFVQKLVLHVLALESSTFCTQRSDTKIAISVNTTCHFRSWSLLYRYTSEVMLGIKRYLKHLEHTDHVKIWAWLSNISTVAQPCTCSCMFSRHLAEVSDLHTKQLLILYDDVMSTTSKLRRKQRSVPIKAAILSFTHSRCPLKWALRNHRPQWNQIHLLVVSWTLLARS